MLRFVLTLFACHLQACQGWKRLFALRSKPSERKSQCASLTESRLALRYCTVSLMKSDSTMLP